MDGGTFTISNGGVFGSLMGTPIINPPQSAILGMHGIFDRPVAIQGKVCLNFHLTLFSVYIDSENLNVTLLNVYIDNENFIDSNPRHEPISCHWPLSVSPENFKKTKSFLMF